MPGGLLVVEAVLVPGLVSSGMTLPAAISAMLIYRLISWIFIAAIGWVVFFFMFRTENALDPDDDSITDRCAVPRRSSKRPTETPCRARYRRPNPSRASLNRADPAARQRRARRDGTGSVLPRRREARAAPGRRRATHRPRPAPLHEAHHLGDADRHLALRRQAWSAAARSSVISPATLGLASK